MGIVCSEGKNKRTISLCRENSLNNSNSSNIIKRSNTNNNKNKIKKKNKNKKSNSDKGSFQKKALTKHNEFRKKHQSKKLNLNKELSEMAKKFADECAQNNTIDIGHCPDLYKNEIIGQNIAVISRSLFDVKNICQKWYDEGNNYDYKQNKYMSNTGHFTQIIWKETTEVGFGYSESKDGNIYFVANYYPAGNIFNKFQENVGEKK